MGHTALHEASEERLLDRPVEDVKGGLEPGVPGVGRYAECAAPAGQPELHPGCRDEHDRCGDPGEDELYCEVSLAETQPRRAARKPVRDCVGGDEGQEPNEDVGARPCPAVWNTRQDEAR